MNRVRVRAPGRVNLIGDHTDYTGGLVLPMAIDRWTVIEGVAADDVELVSDDEPEPARFSLPVVGLDRLRPRWGRYLAAVAAETEADHGVRGTVRTTIPIGAGLSSSAALEVSGALAFGYRGDRVALAEACRRAEHRASGVPCGIMDQLVIATAVESHAMMIDCRSLQMQRIVIPEDIEIVVEFVAHRTLAGSEYTDRVAQCAAAERVIGPLRDATPSDLSSLDDPLVRKRARHVITENERVMAFADALASGDAAAAGALMVAGHRSLAADFETSTPAMDAAVERMVATPGVFGARMTGGGFGGCVVALCRPGALRSGWTVRPVAGAQIEEDS